MTQESAHAFRLLVAAEYFPSRIQPWLLNSIEEAMRRGADVEIVASKSAGAGYPEKVDRLRLLGRTIYLPVHGLEALMGGIRHFVPGSKHRARAWRGAARVLASRQVRRLGVKRLARSVLHGSLAGGGSVDLVHAHSIPIASDYFAVPLVLDCPLVVTFHGLPPIGVAPLAPGRCREVFERTALFLVNTRFAQRQLESMGCPAGKIRILPQGLKLEDHPFRSRPHPANGKLVVLTVARLQPDKGHEFALRAIALLVRKGIDIEYRMVGPGPERARLEQLARELGIADRVVFAGLVDDAGLRKELDRAHLFVLPSVRDEVGFHEETQGVAIQEAQASGLIVISTRTGGIPECVDDARSAFLVPDRDAGALALALEQVIAQPQCWPQWQALGRQWVEANFDIEKLGDRLWTLYAEARAAHRESSVATRPAAGM